MTEELNKIVADLMEMRIGEAQGIMMMANSDDTMFEDCITRLKALAAHPPEERPIPVPTVAQSGGNWAVWIWPDAPYIWAFDGEQAELKAHALALSITRAQERWSSSPQKTT